MDRLACARCKHKSSSVSVGGPNVPIPLCRLCKQLYASSPLKLHPVIVREVELTQKLPPEESWTALHWYTLDQVNNRSLVRNEGTAKAPAKGGDEWVQSICKKWDDLPEASKTYYYKTLAESKKKQQEQAMKEYYQAFSAYEKCCKLHNVPLHPDLIPESTRRRQYLTKERPRLGSVPAAAAAGSKSGPSASHPRASSLPPFLSSPIPKRPRSGPCPATHNNAGQPGGERVGSKRRRDSHENDSSGQPPNSKASTGTRQQQPPTKRQSPAAAAKRAAPAAPAPRPSSAAKTEHASPKPATRRPSPAASPPPRPSPVAPTQRASPTAPTPQPRAATTQQTTAKSTAAADVGGATAQPAACTTKETVAHAAGTVSNSAQTTQTHVQVTSALNPSTMKATTTTTAGAAAPTAEVADTPPTADVAAAPKAVNRRPSGPTGSFIPDPESAFCSGLLLGPRSGAQAQRNPKFCGIGTDEDPIVVSDDDERRPKRARRPVGGAPVDSAAATDAQAGGSDKLMMPTHTGIMTVSDDTSSTAPAKKTAGTPSVPPAPPGGTTNPLHTDDNMTHATSTTSGPATTHTPSKPPAPQGTTPVCATVDENSDSSIQPPSLEAQPHEGVTSVQPAQAAKDAVAAAREPSPVSESTDALAGTQRGGGASSEAWGQEPLPVTVPVALPQKNDDGTWCHPGWENSVRWKISVAYDDAEPETYLIRGYHSDQICTVQIVRWDVLVAALESPVDSEGDNTIWTYVDELIGALFLEPPPDKVVLKYRQVYGELDLNQGLVECADGQKLTVLDFMKTDKTRNKAKDMLRVVHDEGEYPLKRWLVQYGFQALHDVIWPGARKKR